MALPAPIEPAGTALVQHENIELGTVGVSLATQHQAWSLETAASLLESYILRQQCMPDLDQIVASKNVESHCTQDLLQEKAYTPFEVVQITLPPALLKMAGPHTKVGWLAGISTVWVSNEHHCLFWNIDTSEVKEFSVEIVDKESNDWIVDIACVCPDRQVFSDEVLHLLVVSTTKDMRLYAVDKKDKIFSTDLQISIANLGNPLVRATCQGRIFFSCERGGTNIWEFKYAAKESWFKPKVQRVCHGDYGGLFFNGLFGSSATSKDAEHIRNFEIDDTTSILYALTTKSNLHIYFIGNNSFSSLKTITSKQFIQTASYSMSRLNQIQPQSNNGEKLDIQRTVHKDSDFTVVAIHPVSSSESKHVRMVAVTKSGARIYIRSPDFNRPTQMLAPSYIQLASSTSPEPFGELSTMYGGGTTYAVASSSILCSSIDYTRIRHQADIKANVSFVELSGWLHLDNPAVLVNTGKLIDLVITTTSLYKIRRRPFSDRFEYTDTPFSLAQVYGPMQMSNAALTVAAQSSNRVARENAIGSFFRFGGMPMFKRDQLQPGFLGHCSIRLSASFDGLALYLVQILLPIWSKNILGENYNPPDKILLDNIYSQLSGLVELLNRNRSFSEGMSERSSASVDIAGNSAADDLALLSQAEYKGLQALAHLAKSSQEGIAFLRLVLTQYDTKQLLSYFDNDKMKLFKEMTFRQFFVEAKNSALARELVNSLVNYVLNKGDSVDAVASVLQDHCSLYCSAGDVLEYKALEYIHMAKKSKHPDFNSLAKSVALIRKAASSIQLDTLRDVTKDYAQLKYYSGAIQVCLAVAAEQDPANVAVGFLRSRYVHTGDLTSKRFKQDGLEHSKSDSQKYKVIPVTSSNDFGARGDGPSSESEAKFKAKMAIFDIIFSEVLGPFPEIADTTCKDPAHVAMLQNDDEVWHFAFYDWCLSNGKQDQVALLDTQFVANYLQLGASRDLQVANLLWKWHQRHGDLLAAADVLLDLARGSLVRLSQRVEYLSRALGFCQAQLQQNTLQSVNMLTMVRAYLSLALIQNDIVTKLEAVSSDIDASELQKRILTASELFNDWAEPYGLFEICFSIFELTDMRDPVEIQTCWLNLLNKTRAEDDQDKVQHYTHITSLISRIGSKFKSVESIFSVGQLLPMLERYSVDFCCSAPIGWIVDAFHNVGITYETLLDEYTNILSNQMLEGEYAVHARESLGYLKKQCQLTN